MMLTSSAIRVNTSSSYLHPSLLLLLLHLLLDTKYAMNDLINRLS